MGLGVASLSSQPLRFLLLGCVWLSYRRSSYLLATLVVQKAPGYDDFISSVSCIILSHSFLGLATGIAVSGYGASTSSLPNLCNLSLPVFPGVGGLALSPITQTLIDTVGFRWTLRITGLMTLVGKLLWA